MVSSLQSLCRVEILINTIYRMRNDNFSHFSIVYEEEDKTDIYVAAFKTNTICVEIMGSITIVL